jgi:predicted nucleic acid-binding protein
MALSVYLDASILVALFTSQEPLTARANTFVEEALPELVISDFAGAEFASAIARLTRMALLTGDQAAAIFADFDVWTSRAARRVESSTADIIAANAFIRRLTLNLRTPDALNIAMAQRLGTALATFDTRLAENATALGVELVAVPH